MPIPTGADERRLALSCLLLGFVGPTPPDWLLRALEAGLGGVVLFGSNVAGGGIDALTARLRDAAGRDIVVAIDEEGGDVTRIYRDTGGSPNPGAAALGFLDDPDATERVYAATGQRLAQCGITLDLAPVADVNLEPDNPVIGVRSFSADPRVAARHVAAAVRGLQSAGLAACLKHFPGHGATRADSHHQVATLDRTLDQLRAAEFVPFRAGIDAGTQAVMTAHLLTPALDPGALATLSRAVTTTLLRGELDFDGTVVTDALEMRALADTDGMVGGFVHALAAGADAIETGALDYPRLVDEIPDAVAAALRDGTLTVERLRDAAARTARLARPTARSGAGEPLDPAALEVLAARCVEVIGRLPRAVAPLVVECRPPGGMATGELRWSLAEPLRALVPGTDAVEVTGETPAGADPGAIVAGIADRAAGRTLVVVARDPHRHPWQHRLVELAAGHPRAVLVDVGWPVPIEGAVPIESAVPAGTTVPVVRTRGVAPGLLAGAAKAIAEGGAA